MNKTITMLTKDTYNALAQICNNSGLPMCVLELLLKDLYIEVSRMANNQYEKDYIEYKKIIEHPIANEHVDMEEHSVDTEIIEE